jgi:hypothetical protein
MGDYAHRQNRPLIVFASIGESGHRTMTLGVRGMSPVLEFNPFEHACVAAFSESAGEDGIGRLGTEQRPGRIGSSCKRCASGSHGMAPYRSAKPRGLA